MALNSENVRVGITGAVYVAPSGTPLPSTFDSALDAAFVDLGYLGDGGVEESHDDDTKEITAWQNGATVRRWIAATEMQFSFTMIETTNHTLELFHKGSNIISDGADGWKMLVQAPGADRRVVVIDVLDGDEAIRIVAPDAEVTERDSVTYGDSEIGYKVTLTAYPTTQSGVANVSAIKLSGSPGWNL